MGVYQCGKLQYQRGDRVVDGNPHNGEGDEMEENMLLHLIPKPRYNPIASTKFKFQSFNIEAKKPLLS